MGGTSPGTRCAAVLTWPDTWRRHQRGTLKQQGILTDEFAAAKAKVLGLG